MKVNRIIILSIFILAVFIMGAVSAEDNATDVDEDDELGAAFLP